MDNSRERSYYYVQQQEKNKEKSKRFSIPRFVRRFYYRYPRSLVYGVCGAVLGMWISPFFVSSYRYLTMSEKDYETYCREERSKAERRARTGEGLIIPFFKTTFDLFSPEESYLSDMRHERRKKIIKRDFDKVAGFFGLEPPIEVPEDD